MLYVVGMELIFTMHSQNVHSNKKHFGVWSGGVGGGVCSVSLGLVKGMENCKPRKFCTRSTVVVVM